MTTIPIHPPAPSPFEVETTSAAQALLMCAPDYFTVDYVINPWMERQIGRVDAALARRQWRYLHQRLSEYAPIRLVAPRPGLPDMVFTANAGLALEGVAVVSRFRAAQRRPEEPLFREWFESHGYVIADWPQDIAFEGAGDALADPARQLIWCGYGWRTDEAAPDLLETIFNRPTLRLRLVDPRFYHLDTCFCPLTSGDVIYYPAAFDESSLAAIRSVVTPDKRIEIGEEEARGFACNAVEASGAVFLNRCSATLRERLEQAGFRAIETPLSEFLKAGGAAKCLTLRVSAP